MTDSLIFVAYASSDGKNVTISPRLATGHSMPQQTTDVKVETLAGSGVSSGQYVINARCTACRKWAGNTLDVTSVNQPAIWAAGPAGDLKSDDLDAAIQQHGSYGTSGTFNLVQATGPGGVPSPSSPGNGNGNPNGPDGGGFGQGTNDGFDDNDPASLGRRVHAVFMIGAFLVGFPAGYLFLRVFDRVWIHWTLQSIAALAVLCGTGAGIALSITQSIVSIGLPHILLAGH